MTKILEIRDLNYSYDGQKLYDNFNLSLEEGSFTTIIGPNGSGKTTLVKILNGFINGKAFIKVDKMFINPKNIKEIRKRVGTLFENPDSQFISEYVQDDMYLALQNYGNSKEEINDKIKLITKELNIEHLLSYKSQKLSGGEKQLINLAINLARTPRILIIDEALSMIDSVTREKIYKILQDKNKQGLTIINITHDSEDILRGEDVVIINNGKVVLQEKVNDAFKDVKVYTDNKLELPFIVDLSIKLQYYNTINKIYFDSKELVEKLWK